MGGIFGILGNSFVGFVLFVAFGDGSVVECYGEYLGRDRVCLQVRKWSFLCILHFSEVIISESLFQWMNLIPLPLTCPWKVPFLESSLPILKYQSRWNWCATSNKWKNHHHSKKSLNN
mmetsp:Transcript_14613/g.29628  ORF Transcript_14613/g.29628 Transcript_14613/m.29628 type:complete len:118 (-) Transcript_14613:2117-2470(-)